MIPYHILTKKYIHTEENYSYTKFLISLDQLRVQGVSSQLKNFILGGRAVNINVQVIIETPSLLELKNTVSDEDYELIICNCRDIQGELLLEQETLKNIANKKNPYKIKIIMGDITEMDNVDAIVNSAKTSLKGGSGVDGAIHWKAGGDLMKECRELGGCKIGEAVITHGYNLQVPFIIHAAGPIYQNVEWAETHNYNQAQLLSDAYLNSLLLAKANNLKKIAFSAISTGIYRYPFDKSAKIALDTVTNFLKSNPEFEITFVLYTEDIYQEYLKQIEDYSS